MGRPGKCKDCKRTSPELVPLNDDGSGPMLCRDCKGERRDDLPGQLKDEPEVSFL